MNNDIDFIIRTDPNKQLSMSDKVYCNGTMDNIVTVCSSGKTVVIWDKKTGAEINEFANIYSKNQENIIVSPDGSRLLSFDSSSTYNSSTRAYIYTLNIHILNIESNEKKTYQRTSNDYGLYSVCWSPDSSKIAYSIGKTVEIRDIDSGSITLQISNVLNQIGSIDWHPDGEKLVIASRNKLKIINLDGDIIKEIDKDFINIYSARWSPDGTKISFSARYDNNMASSLNGINVIDYETGTLLLQTESKQKNISYNILENNNNVLWSPDGDKLLIAAGKNVEVWSVSEGIIARFYSNEKISNAAWISNEKIAYIDKDNIYNENDIGIQIRDLLINYIKFDEHIGTIKNMKWTLNSNRSVSFGDDKTIKIWDQFGNILESITGIKSQINDLALSPCSSVLAFCEQGMIQIWGNIEENPSPLMSIMTEVTMQQLILIRDLIICTDGIDLYIYNLDGELQEKRLLGNIKKLQVMDIESKFSFIKDDSLLMAIDLDKSEEEYIMDIVDANYKFTLSGDRVVVYKGNNIVISEVKTLDKIYDGELQNEVESVSWSITGNYIATKTHDKIIMLDVNNKNSYIEHDLQGDRGFMETIGGGMFISYGSPGKIKNVNGYSYEHGDGTENNPYIIDNLEGLLGIRYGQSDSYKLNNNIEINAGWSVLGSIEFGNELFGFSGTLDGNGHTISNLKMNGLFVRLSSNAIVKNIIFTNVDIRKSIFGECSENNVTIENCQIYGHVKNASSLIRWPSGSNLTIKQCKFEGTIENGNGFLGCLGDDSLVDGCIFNGNIINGNGILGDIFGTNSTVKNCTMSGEIESGSGIMGSIRYDHNSVKNCHVNATITTSDFTERGGVLEYAHGSSVLIEGCSFIGNIEVSNVVLTGGILAGANPYSGNTDHDFSIKIINCHVDADILTKGDVGGIIGKLFMGLFHPIVKDCTFKGSISGRRIGGIASFCYGHVINCSVNADLYAITGFNAGIVSQTVLEEQMIENCIFRGSITDYLPNDENDKHICGLVGYLKGSKISECIAEASMVTNKGNVNGLVTYLNGGTIEKSIFIGELDTNKIYEGASTSNNYCPSGLVGFMYISTSVSDEDDYIPGIRDCFVRANISGDISAGICSQYCSDHERMQRVYFEGELNSDKAFGISMIYMVEGDKNKKHSWFYSCDNKDATSEYGSRKTIRELKDIEEFDGWDFDNVWTIDDDGLPTLRWIVDSGAGDNQDESNENKEQSCFIFIM